MSSFIGYKISFFREDKGKTQLIPPAKNEKIVAKVTRYLSSNDPDHSEADNKEDDTDSLSVMSSSTTTIGKEKLFSSEECALLRELWKEVISKPPISIERIERALKESKEGVALLDRFSSKQIQNRLKYERRTLLR